MAAAVCLWGRGQRVSARHGSARVGVGPGFPPHALSPAGAVLEPGPALRLARPAHLRCVRQGNLHGEDHAAERTVEDVFLRKFMRGTFPGCLADQLVLKRRANQVDICAVVLRQLPAHKFYFLVGYSETLLSHFYKCPVRLHLQTVPAKVVYKYI
uniref:28S ribosomal protein S24, mitochondrial n=1 Tax=Castor canadensis TaxID=51338 RepID=A0A8C0ZTD8_CASCN